MVLTPRDAPVMTTTFRSDVMFAPFSLKWTLILGPGVKLENGRSV
jgi:hypothetical protein